MAKNPKRKVVYSVMSVDVKSDDPVQADVVGSYCSKEDAVRACADYIIERIRDRPDIRYALYNDVNHKDALRKELKAKSGVSYARLKTMFKYKMSEYWELPKNVRDVLWGYLRWNIECFGPYEIGTDMESDIGVETYIFDVQENPIYKGVGNGKGK